MARLLIDRMTINFSGEDDLHLADQFRTLCGTQPQNQVLKRAIQEYVQRHTPTQK